MLLAESGATIDRGRLAAPREEGLCCHDSVPERAKLVALDGALAGDSGVSEDGAGVNVDGVAIVGLLEDPNPLNSGTSGGEAWAVVGLLVGVEEDAGGLVRRGVRTLPAAFVVDEEAGVDGAAPFLGLMDLALSGK